VHRTSKLPLSPKPAQLRISGEGRSPHKFPKHQRLRSPSHVSEFENNSVYCRATGKCCCARSETESQVCPVNAWLVRLFPPGTAQRTDQVQEVGLSTLEERLVKTTGGRPSYLAWETVSDVRRTSCQPGPFREANVNFSFAVKSAPRIIPARDSAPTLGGDLSPHCGGSLVQQPRDLPDRLRDIPPASPLNHPEESQVFFDESLASGRNGRHQLRSRLLPIPYLLSRVRSHAAPGILSDWTILLHAFLIRMFTHVGWPKVAMKRRTWPC
jgi:hypothetical protein